MNVMADFRLDRFLTLHFFSHITGKQTSIRNKRIPILMYHSISDEKETTHPYYRVNTSPAVFNAHMLYLRENDYAIIDLKNIKSIFNSSDSARNVVITFDDGFYDFLATAFPVLKKYKFNATVFLPTGFIHNERLSFKGKPCLNWEEVRKLSREGVSFGSHTITHPELSRLSEKEIENEISLSKNRIEDETGKEVTSFSCPYAFPEDREFMKNLKNLLIKYGYVNGVTTRIGTTDIDRDTYFQPRLPVNSDDDLVLFRAKLEGAYDWLNKPQTFIKRIKGK